MIVQQALAQSFLNAFKAVLKGGQGINPKVNRNTLEASNIANTATSTYRDKGGDFIVELLVNDYIQYIESGRRKGAKFPPVEPIIQWCKKNGIPTDNNTVFLIRRAISRDGIKPRALMQYVWQDMDAQMDSIFYDKILDYILTDLNKYFND